MYNIEEYRLIELSRWDTTPRPPNVTHRLVGYCQVQGNLAPCTSSDLVYGESQSKIKELEKQDFHIVGTLKRPNAILLRKL